MRSIGLTSLLAIFLATQSDAQAARTPYRYSVPPALTDGWATASLEAVGIDRRRLEAMTDSIRAQPALNIHAVLIEKGGRLVYEEYFAGEDQRWGQPLGRVVFTRETRHDLRSVTKSVVSALVGIAAASGAIRSLDAPLLDYFPELADLQTPERRKITIRHALSMSAGFEWNEDVPYNDPRNDEIVMSRSAEPIRYVLSRPIATEPGSAWNYNGGTTQVLGAIVQRATKRPLAEYARSELFAPLGVTDIEWVGDLAGVPAAASGLRLRPRDLAKFGSLYLHGGQWRGTQVIPASWVTESTRRQLTFPNQQARGYAYQWWHRCYPGSVEVPTAVGNGEQRIFLLRSHDVVVTVLSGRYNDFSQRPAEALLLQHILPALPPSAPLPACPKA